MKSWILMLSWTASSGTFTGCGPSLNTSDGLLGEHPIPALLTSEQETTLAVEDRVMGEMVALDRSAWTRHVIRLDPAQVQHHPSYGSFQPVISELSRGGDWPTFVTAFCTGSDGSDEVANGLLAPPAAAIELIILPFRMIQTPPWKTMTAPEGLRILPPSDGDDAQRLRSRWLGSDTIDEEESR